MTALAAPYRSAPAAGRGGFVQLLRAEWTKLRTVRGWTLGLLAAPVVVIGIGLMTAVGGQGGCSGPPGQACAATAPPVGPGGETVHDSFSFVQQRIGPDATVTARVTSLTGLVPAATPSDRQDPSRLRSGLTPWAKGGLILRAGTAQGSAYAAIMVTAEHGVRMQENYTHDRAGSGTRVSQRDPIWLRLTRSGSQVTGYESADGIGWTKVGTVHLQGLPTTVPAGLFVTSPDYQATSQRLGGAASISAPSQATAVFDNVSVEGQQGAGSSWSREVVGGGGPGGALVPEPEFSQAGETFTISGSGDIGPATGGPGPNTIETSLVGGFAGMILLIVVGTLFVTSEYRRGLVRTSLAAAPRRGRWLAAKALVLAGVAFGAGLLCSAGAYWVVGLARRASGSNVIPVPAVTQWRVVVGTAAVMAVAALLGLAVGVVLRRSAGAAAAVVLVVVLPYILAVASVLPAGAAQWLLRVTPAAGFAVQQSIPQYAQVAATYTPSTGYFPLSPAAGFGVLCAWTAVAFGVAAVVLRRRDA